MTLCLIRNLNHLTQKKGWLREKEREMEKEENWGRGEKGEVCSSPRFLSSSCKSYKEYSKIIISKQQKKFN